ncbi:hypothetical protein E3N88_19318 [Mikania micrantha]|uniref:Integrase catalytic domain-containing protein n=1 Tax=Mikania micrantha TaxID=192012 RepID=A0A5N6NMW4_9ASTR|nr:hypothetical protein E3N88_19318 [Mikania micrantha]
MADEVVVQGGAAPERNTTSLNCPMLNAINYNAWAVRIKAVFRVHGILPAIEPIGLTLVDPKKNDMAIALLLQSIPEDLVLQVSQFTTAKAIWDALKTRYVGVDRVREARLETIHAEFESLKMGSQETIEAFASKIQQIVSKANTLGHAFEEKKLVQKLLRSVPGKFITIVATIQQFADLNSMPFQEAIGRLKAFEEAIGRMSPNENAAEKLLFQKAESSSKSHFDPAKKQGKTNHGTSRWQGKGSDSSQNREYKQKNHREDSSKGKGKDRSKIQCYRCDKMGHFASVCPDRKQKKEEANLNEANDVDPRFFMMKCGQETVFLNEENLIPKRYEAEPSLNDVWYLDNGASNHMTGNRSFFIELNERITGRVKFGDNSCVEIHGKGSIIFEGRNGEQRVMTDVYYIPDLRTNIISLGQTSENGCETRIKDDYLILLDNSGKLLMRVPRTKNRLYKVQLKPGSPECLQVKLEDNGWKWHARLGHINFETMKLMAHKRMTAGLPTIAHPNRFCDSCLIGKQTRTTFPKATLYRANKTLELVYGDLCGPISPPTLAGNEYIFVIIDDYSRYMWTFMLKRKVDALQSFKSFKAQAENETGNSIKVFRTDRGGEFTSNMFTEFCSKEGINRQLTAPYTPQQNGVVERRNRTLMEMTRSMMKATKVPNYMWGEGVRHATYVINRVHTRALDNQTPYEAYKGRKPNIAHLKIFGCLAYAKNTTPGIKKLEDRSRVLIHLGMEIGSKAYRLCDPQTRKIVISRDVIFNEEKGWEDFSAVSHEKSRAWENFYVNWGEEPSSIHEEAADPCSTRQNSGSSGSSENPPTNHAAVNPPPEDENTSPQGGGGDRSNDNESSDEDRASASNNPRRGNRRIKVPAHLSDYENHPQQLVWIMDPTTLFWVYS